MERRKFTREFKLEAVRLIKERWSRFPGQNGGLAKVDSGFDYAAQADRIEN